MQHGGYMKSQRLLLVSSLALLFFVVGNANAQTCYDPNYGYYDCNQNYSYPDSSQSFVEGAFVGVVLGGFYNNNDGNRNHGGNDENGGHRNWGGGHGGGWNNQGGRHHR